MARGSWQSICIISTQTSVLFLLLPICTVAAEPRGKRNGFLKAQIPMISRGKWGCPVIHTAQQLLMVSGLTHASHPTTPIRKPRFFVHAHGEGSFRLIQCLVLREITRFPIIICRGKIVTGFLRLLYVRPMLFDHALRR